MTDHPADRTDKPDIASLSGHTDGPLARYQEAVAACRTAGEPTALAHALRHVGDLHRRGGRLDEATACYDEALALYRASPSAPPLDLANLLRPMALVCETRGQTAEAVQRWAEARALYADQKIVAGVQESDEHLGRLQGEIT